MELKNQLNACPMTYKDVVRMRRFGVVTKQECEFDLNHLKDPENLPDSANYFYELFILDERGNLIDIPVIISNYIDENDQKPNLTLNKETSQLFRRFFIFDTISGITGSGDYKKNKEPSIVRYATDIKLSIALDPDNQESILKPLLWITYKEKRTSII